MDIFYYRHPSGNFGDDLNSFLWNELLPRAVLDSPGTILIGIGTILDEEKLQHIGTCGRRVFVLGSGAGYGPLPPRLNDWQILGVRGPLTAELLGRPETALTDSAYLVRDLPEIGCPTGDRSAILFMPHLVSLSHCNWPAVADRAGVEFIDPRSSMQTIFEAFSRARLVLSGAMHGAIVADALRIPWVPLAISPRLNVFKWKDWTLSMELPLRFTFVPYPCRYELWRLQASHGRTDASGLFPSTRNRSDEMSELLSEFQSRYGVTPRSRSRAPRGVIHSLGRACADHVLAPAAALFDGALIEKAAPVLRRAAHGQSFLSKDGVLQNRLDRLREGLRILTASVLGAGTGNSRVEHQRCLPDL